MIDRTLELQAMAHVQLLRFKDRIREETGEVGSWMILAAALAVAAAAAAAILGPWIGRKASEITAN